MYIVPKWPPGLGYTSYRVHVRVYVHFGKSVICGAVGVPVSRPGVSRRGGFFGGGGGGVIGRRGAGR